MTLNLAGPPKEEVSRSGHQLVCFWLPAEPLQDASGRIDEVDGPLW